ncbi:Protein DGCR6 [Toxocara canis]|uniref:Protein DGCR6 n=1 Tax=Toxocara canis TaxID=6265 RepID=A0A0B2V562_TOXCA|nr:Protein DGCR6 [Toxocara canis]
MILNDLPKEEKVRLMRQEMDKFMFTLKPKMCENFNPALQTALIESLLDGTVFQIVDSLKDLQQLNEKQLYDERQKRLAELQMVPDLEEQMKRIDMNIMDELDKIVAQQQSTLARAGVPGFRVTNNPFEINLQMEMIRFIMTLHSKYS